jgi:Flp pilus assembly protein TadD
MGLLVAVSAVGVAALTVGVTLATRTEVPERVAARPPFVADPTAPASLQQRVREALLARPGEGIERLRELAAANPRSGLVRLELGLALAAAGEEDAARTAWLEAERVQPDSPSAVRAENLRHPDAPPGRPPFVRSFERPTTPARQHLLRGTVFQQQLRPVSAKREFAAAARLAPSDPEAQVAAAVGLYDKDRPALAFSRLGPLTRRFPRAQTVRFHLGLLLIYLGDLPRARQELALAHAQGPETALGKRAQTLLRAARNG